MIKPIKQVAKEAAPAIDAMQAEEKAKELRERYDIAVAELRAIEKETRRMLTAMSEHSITDRELLNMLCEDHDFDPDQIRNHRRTSALVSKRAVLARELRKRGWTLERIGNAMNRDHSAILYLLNDYQEK